MPVLLRSPQWRMICLVALVCATLALAACSQFPRVYLLNNNGASVELLRVQADRDYHGRIDGWFFGIVRIGNRSGRDILFRSSDLEVRVELKVGRCTYRYDLPPTATVANATAVVQLEADNKLYLVDENAWNARDSYERPVEVWPLQPEGFPVEPVGQCS
jgi:hypothetical protein